MCYLARYSVLKLFTGFRKAAFIAWKLTSSINCYKSLKEEALNKQKYSNKNKRDSSEEHFETVITCSLMTYSTVWFNFACQINK